MPRLIARSTSRFIWGETLAFLEKTSTKTRDSLIASMIDSPQSALGNMSRGAIQQRMPLLSSVAQVASAVGLSLEE